MEDAAPLSPTPTKSSQPPTSKDWFDALKSKPDEEIVSDIQATLEDYPKSEFNACLMTTVHGNAFEYSMSNFYNKRDLRCSSNVSPVDAKSKLLGFLAFMKSGLASFPPICAM
jgi:hypothetical protein